MTEIVMPQLSDSMEEGTVVMWLVADGETVARGEDLVEIETDKATITHAAEAGGVLEIIAPEGTTLSVGAPIARIGATPPAARRDGPRADAEDCGSAPPVVAKDGGGRSGAATPLARRVARVNEIDIGGVIGTGPRGRVTSADVLKAAGAEDTRPGHARVGTRGAPHASAVAVAPASADPLATSETAAPRAASASETGVAVRRIVEPTRLQELVARRMTEAKATIPHFQVQTEVAMDAALTLRAGLKTAGGENGMPSLNDLIVKACATALRSHPRANGSYRDGHFELHGRVNIGVAVAAEEALLVPVITDADRKSLGSIAREARRLAERVRSGTIAPSELSGATFTVSNLGMYGMTAITPVINPPQAAILGVGALRETLARIDGDVADRTLVTLTLSCDHRILYGADAARLLADIRTILEAPLGLSL